MSRYFNVNKVYFNEFTNNSVKNIVNSVNLNNVYFVNNSANSFFSNISNLTSVTNISYNVTDLTNAFSNCTNLKTIPTIPNSVTELGGAFMYCTNLQSVAFEENSAVVNMQDAFYNCTNLQEAIIPPNAVNIYGAFRSCNNIVNAPTIPNTVTNMADAFHYCINLVETPTVPNGIENLQLTFSGTGIIDPPVIPNSVTSMASTFHKCYNLTSAPNIPANVEWMSYTFSQCQNLSGDIKIESEKVKDAGACFNNTVKAKDVYIPYEYEEPGELEEKGINGTIVGTLTNVNNVISGFNPRNCLNIGKAFLPGSSSFEIVVKFKQSDISTRCKLFGTSSNSDHKMPAVQCNYNGNGYLGWAIPDSSGNSWQNETNSTAVSLSINTWYWAKLTCSSSFKYVLSYSTDGTNYTELLTYNGTQMYQNSSYNFCFGNDLYGSSSCLPFLGEIDLNETYIKINDELWWEGTKYLLNYSVNGTIIGTLNDNMGIISGFSDTDHLLLPNTLSTGDNNWEIVLKIKPVDTSTGGQDIAGYVGTTGGLSFYLSVDGELSYHVGNSSTWVIEPIFGYCNMNEWIWLKAKYENGTYYAYTSNDGTNYNLIQSISNTWKLQPGQMWIGDFATGGTHWFNGSVDLSECYIKINNKLWWTGLKYKNTNTYKAFESEYPPEIEGTVYGTGIVNNGGIVNGFTTSNALFLPWSTDTTNTIMYAKFTTTTSGDGKMILFGGYQYTLYFYYSSLTLTWWSGPSYTYNTITTLNPNTTYWIKMVHNGSTHTLYLSSDGQTYSQLYQMTNQYSGTGNQTYQIGGEAWNGSTTNNPFNGYIDLNEFYITDFDNNILYKGVYNPFTADSRKAIPNGTIVGNVTNNNNVISNFAMDTSYFTIPYTNFRTDLASTWEFKLKFNIDLSLSSQRIIGGEVNSNSRFQIVIGTKSTNNLCMWLSTNGSSWNLASGIGNYILTAGQYYYCKATFDGNNYKLLISTDDITYTEVTSISSNDKLTCPPYDIRFGGSTQGTMSGYIDLKECMIIVDGKTTWTGTEYINNGVLFHDINAIPEIDVSEYEYELNGQESVTLTRYIGEGGAVTIPGV